jgi:hypothetical protein
MNFNYRSGCGDLLLAKIGPPLSIIAVLGLEIDIEY